MLLLKKHGYYNAFVKNYVKYHFCGTSCEREIYVVNGAERSMLELCIKNPSAYVDNISGVMDYLKYITMSSVSFVWDETEEGYMYWWNAFRALRLRYMRKEFKDYYDECDESVLRQYNG